MVPHNLFQFFQPGREKLAIVLITITTTATITNTIITSTITRVTKYQIYQNYKKRKT